MLRALLGPVTVKTVANNDEEGKDVGRNCQELGVVSFETERGDDRGGKVPESIKRVGHEEVLDGEEPEEGLHDGLLGDLAVPVLVAHRGSVGAKALDGECSLLGGEPRDSRGVWSSAG